MFVPAALVACALVLQGPPPESLSHADLDQRMHALEASSAGLCRVLTVAHSRVQREVLALELKAAGAPADQPAILVVGNLEGPQVFTSACALWEAEELVRLHAAGDEAVRALLDSTTLYFVPRANPDAAEAHWATAVREQRGTGQDVDNDRDGRFGEDGPSDVDGDGFVAQLRVLDPDGRWIEDPNDARALIEADPVKGERGRWKLFPEGLDADGDEVVGDDPGQDTELNHNFAHGWEEHTARGGLFPMDEPEARGLAEFMLAHDDIALVLCYGELDNLVKAPTTAKEDAPAKHRIPAAGVIEPDAKLLAELGERYKDLVEQRFEGSGAEAGSFQSWTYRHRGLLTLSIRPWDIPLDAKQPEPEPIDEGDEAETEAADEETDEQKPAKGKQPELSDDAKRLVWIDVNDEQTRFLPWTAFEHPQLGPVEIGGFAPYARTDPPSAETAELVDAQLAFLLTLGADLPRVALSDCTATTLGEGLLEVEAFVTISGRLPLQTLAARRARTVRPARVTLVLPDGAEIVAGKRLGFVSELGVGERARFRWLVLAPAGSEVGITVDTDNAGSARSKAEVN